MMYLLLFLTKLSASTITVKGNCIRAVTPDRASIQFQIVTRHPKNPQVAVKETITRMQKLSAKLKTLNLPNGEFSTTTFQVDESREWDGQKQVFKGYQAIQGLKVTSSDLEKISESMKVASEMDVTSIESFSTFLSPALYQEEYKKCLTTAVTQAADKAKLVAESLKKDLKELSQLLESGTRAPEPIIRNAKTMEGAQAFSSGPDIQAGSIMVQAEIESTYSLK